MTPSARCSSCACELPTDAPRALCPACLLAVGLAPAPTDGSLPTADTSATAPSLPSSPLSSTHVDDHASGDDALPTIPRYQLNRVIGAGGMGVVYKAEQQSPVRRTVALKLIKLGMDTRQVIARFESERQALALMHHRNIAAVFDAGATDAGRPFFVMEYVPGEPITQFCDRHRYTIRQRLELFLQVCHAIQHAHTKAILHRDVKPSNMLVMLEDGQPVVKVIDFGIARAVARGAGEQTAWTEAGQIIGTPEYMSPEQAEAGQLDVDTRTDIYSLGVVLYELITGALPFDSAVLRARSYGTLQQIIRDVDPPRPSARLSGLGESSLEVARLRQTSVIALTRELRSELEWIPLKAIRKDPSHRYPSVAALAEDVGNYIAGRPLKAGPESGLYRAKKLLSRNRGKATAVALIIISVLLGLGGTYLGMRRASRMAVSENELRKLAEHRQRRAELDRYATQFRFAADGAKSSRDGPDAVQLLAACDEALRGWEWQYLHRRLTASSRILRPPGAAELAGVSVSTDGRRFAAIGSVNPPESEAPAGSSQPSTRPAQFALWAWDADRLIATRNLEIADGIDQQPPGDDLVFPTITCDPDGRFFAYSDLKGTLRLCSAESNRVLWTAALGRSCAGQFSDDGRYFVCAAADGDAFLVQPSTVEVKRFSIPRVDRTTPPLPHWGPQTVLALSPEADLLAIGTGDGSVIILETRSGNVTAQIQVDNRPVVGLRFAGHPARVLAATGRFTMHADTGFINDRPGNVIVLAQGDPSTENNGDAKPGAHWHIENSLPTDQTLLDATLDLHGVLVAVGTGSRLDEWSWYVPYSRLEYRSGIPEDLGSFSTSARFDGSGKTAFRALFGAVQILDRDVARGFRRLTPAVQSKQPLDRDITPPRSWPLGNAEEIIATSPEHDRAFVRYSSNAIFEFDLKTGSTHRLMINGVTPYAIRAFSLDGRTVVVASGLRVQFIDRGSGRMLSETDDLPYPCVHASYSPDGQTLWIAADDWSRKGAAPNASAVLAWDVQQRRWTARHHFADRGIHSMITSPDGRWIGVLKTHDPQPRELEVLDTTLRSVFALAAQPNGIRSVGDFGFRPDGGAIAVVSAVVVQGVSMSSAQPGPAQDQIGLRLRQFALPGGSALGSEYGGSSECHLPDNHVDRVMYSPDGRRIVTGGHKLRVWDAATGQPLLELADKPGASGQFCSFRFVSSDRLLAANGNGSLYVFEAASATPSTTAPASDGQSK